MFHFQEGTIRVLIDNGLGYFTDILQKLSVMEYPLFSNQSNAALLGSFQIWPASFKSASAISETIVRAYHNLQTFPGIFRQFITGHSEYTRLVGSAPYDHGADEAGKVRNVFASTVYHHGSVRYIHTDFKTVVATIICASPETNNCICILFGRFHFPVHLQTPQSETPHRYADSLLPGS